MKLILVNLADCWMHERIAKLNSRTRLLPLVLTDCSTTDSDYCHWYLQTVPLYGQRLLPVLHVHILTGCPSHSPGRNTVWGSAHPVGRRAACSGRSPSRTSVWPHLSSSVAAPPRTAGGPGMRGGQPCSHWPGAHPWSICRVRGEEAGGGLSRPDSSQLPLAEPCSADVPTEAEAVAQAQARVVLEVLAVVVLAYNCNAQESTGE